MLNFKFRETCVKLILTKLYGETCKIIFIVEVNSFP